MHEDELRAYLRRVMSLPLLSPSEEIALLREADDDGPRLQLARARLVGANLHLAVSVAKKYTGRGLPLADLIQASNLGLAHAVEHYDHRAGHRFSTYAVWWMRRAIVRAIREQSGR